jgi:carboxypeptidase C (cathepsin A)
VREELKFESDLPYEPLTGKVQPWNFGGFNGRFVTVSESLRQAMVQNPFLKVYVANGIYDLATPYYATKYTIDHLGMAPEVIKNVHVYDYPAGHMMYTHPESLQKMKRDLDSFLDTALEVK